ncbi:hypothetical protein EDD21DRAFT_13599 [Dissophora ornata]|nr:hypothetical protein EDD21DRAFT_13599 [Dissophora ornata]
MLSLSPLHSPPLFLSLPRSQVFGHLRSAGVKDDHSSAFGHFNLFVQVDSLPITCMSPYGSSALVSPSAIVPRLTTPGSRRRLTSRSVGCGYALNRSSAVYLSDLVFHNAMVAVFVSLPSSSESMDSHHPTELRTSRREWKPGTLHISESLILLQQE